MYLQLIWCLGVPSVSLNLHFICTIVCFRSYSFHFNIGLLYVYIPPIVPHLTNIRLLILNSFASDCKKNKGSILKNSVEYITVLQKENQCYTSLFNETNLANTLIDRMVKRIQVGLPSTVVFQQFLFYFCLCFCVFLSQALESILPPEYLAKVASEGVADYRTILQEWSKVHEMNHQRISSGATTGVGGAAGVSFDTSESSPGMSSVGNNEDGSFLDARGEISSLINYFSLVLNRRLS